MHKLVCSCLFVVCLLCLSVPESVLVLWCVGMLVCWCVSVLVCWCVGVLVCWCVDVCVWVCGGHVRVRAFVCVCVFFACVCTSVLFFVISAIGSQNDDIAAGHDS